jgi:hypothetical protein
MEYTIILPPPVSTSVGTEGKLTLFMGQGEKRVSVCRR